MKFLKAKAKRFFLRLTALAAVVALAVVAVGQLKHAGKPEANADDATGLSRRGSGDSQYPADPFSSARTKMSRQPASLSEPARLDDGLPARPASKRFADDDLPTRRNGPPDTIPAAQNSSALANDPYGLRAERPSLYAGKRTVAERPVDPLAGDADPLGAPRRLPRESSAMPIQSSPSSGNSSPPPQSGSGFTRVEVQPDSADGSLSSPPRQSPGATTIASSTLPSYGGSGVQVSPPAQLGAPQLASATSDLGPANAAAEGNGRPGSKLLEGAQVPQLQVEKLAPAEVQVGKSAVFVTKIRNVGKVVAQSVEVHDEIPRGAQMIKTTPSAQTGPHGELIWPLGTLRPNDETSVQMELMPTTEGEMGSVATVQFRTDATARSVVTRPQLALQVSAPKQVMIGSSVTLSISISNPGTGAASGVVLEEKVPTQLKHVAGPELEFEVGNLRPGETRQLELTMTAAIAGQVHNLITAKGEGNLKAEQQADFEVIAPMLEVGVSGPTRRYLERPATYTISVTNPGTAPARDVHLVTYLPRGLKFIKANNSGQYESRTHSVQWNLDELPPSETGNVTLTTVPTESGEQKLTIDGKAQQGLSDHKEQAVIIDGLAAVMFEVSDTEDPIEVNGQTTYEIRVVNQGTKTASNIQILGIAPVEAKPLSADGPTRAAIAGQQITFEPLARLAPKADVTYKIRAQALSAGDLRFKVQLLSDDNRTPITKEESTRVYADQ